MTRLAALIVTAVVALAAPAPVLGAAGEPPFCDRTIVAQVPGFTGKEPKPDGRLGFGPSSIRMRILPRLVATGGKIGFELFLHPGASAAHPRWKVRANLGRLHPRRNLQVFIASKERRVLTVDRSHRTRFAFEVAGEPSYYLVTAYFTTPNGRRVLGHFRLYFKVIPTTREARLVLDADSYRRGQTVFGRVENHGTEPVQFGAPYRIERRDGSSWSLAPESPDVFILPIYGAFPGESGQPCSPFSIPSSMPPGHYRMVKEVSFPPSEPGEERIASTLAAEFEIVP